MKTLAFDFETSGIPKHPDAKMSIQPRAIELAGIIVNSEGEELETFETLINPEMALEPIITKITGLTYEDDLIMERPFAEQVDEIADFFSRADCMLAHNLPFDSTILELELQRCAFRDFPWPEYGICTVQEHAEEWGYRPKLLQLYQWYTKKKYEQVHRALDDVRLLVEVAKASGCLL